MFGSFVMDAAGSSPAISKMYFVRQIHKYDQFGEIAQIAYITRGLFGGIIFCREKKRGRVWKGINWMAHYTEKAIISSFQEMLEEMPFDKITVTALTKRSDISPNTFTIIIRTSMHCWITGWGSAWIPFSSTNHGRRAR